MRSLYTLAVVLALAGCGDDSTGPADMAMALDQGMASADCAGYCAQMEQVCVAGDGSQAVTPPYLSSSDCMDYVLSTGDLLTWLLQQHRLPSKNLSAGMR